LPTTMALREVLAGQTESNSLRLAARLETKIRTNIKGQRMKRLYVCNLLKVNTAWLTS
jgi:hypothetical protein